MKNPVDKKVFNRELVNQAHSTRRRIVGRISRMTVSGKTQLLKKVRSPQARQSLLDRMSKEKVLGQSLFVNFGKDAGEIDRIGFKFPLHGVFTHHGVGKGHPASDKRKQTEWLNPVLNDDMDNFANIVARHYADATLNATRLKI